MVLRRHDMLNPSQAYERLRKTGLKTRTRVGKTSTKLSCSKLTVPNTEVGLKINFQIELWHFTFRHSTKAA